MLLKKDFRSQSEEESFKNGFLSRILIQISRISYLGSRILLLPIVGVRRSLIDFFNSIGQSRRFGDVGGLSVVPHGRYQIAALRQVTFRADFVAEVGAERMITLTLHTPNEAAALVHGH
jgi:hypothetical protein